MTDYKLSKRLTLR